MKPIKAAIATVDYVSFDIFDTAILRAVQKPTDVFLIVLEKYQQLYGQTVDGFRNKRVHAEQLARDRAWHDGQRTEVTLAEIYQCLQDEYAVTMVIAEQLLALELETELQICQQNSYIFGVYQYCLAKGKKVIFTSDIYLPEELISNMLEQAGYNQYERLFVSSTLMLTKATGKLYQHVVNELNCKPAEVLHIGDNYNADVKKSVANGLQSHFYEKCHDLAKRDRKHYPLLNDALSEVSELEKSLFLATIINKYYSGRETDPVESTAIDDFWYKLGYTHVGILYLTFVQWLTIQFKQDNVDKVFFLARDGFIMQEVFQRFKASMPGLPDSEYLYASRRALNIPAISELDEKDIDFLVSGTSRLTVAEFLERIGLNADTYIQEIQQAGFVDARTKVLSGGDYGRLRELYRLLKNVISAQAVTERKILKKYFSAMGVLEPGNIAFVDIGWHGSLQRSLQRLLQAMDVKPTMKGYYLGTFPPAQDIVAEGHEMSAFLCENGEPDKCHRVIKQCVEVFEFIHSAPHGSVIRMQQDGDTIKPLFDHDLGEQGKKQKAELLQLGAMDFVDDFLASWKHFQGINLSRELAIAAIERLLSQPTLDEAINLGNLEHAEGYGEVYVKRYIARPEKTVRKLFNPVAMLRGYRDAFWRAGYLKRLMLLR